MRENCESARVTHPGRTAGSVDSIRSPHMISRLKNSADRGGRHPVPRLRQENRIGASLVVTAGTCSAIRWVVVKDGREVVREDYPLPEGVKPVFPLRFRVQMLAVGVNLFLETHGQSHLIACPDFSAHLELRQKSLMQRFEFCLHTDLSAGAAVVIREMTAALSPGCGQADIRAITRPDGSPLIDEGRLWFTMTVRGRGLPHPLQGVFSMNPLGFRYQVQGIIVFDTGDGMLRNELASHLFYDDASKEWRGWTVGFSAYGSDAKGTQKAVLAVSSTRDPRKGFPSCAPNPSACRKECTRTLMGFMTRKRASGACCSPSMPGNSVPACGIPMPGTMATRESAGLSRWTAPAPRSRKSAPSATPCSAARTARFTCAPIRDSSLRAS